MIINIEKETLNMKMNHRYVVKSHISYQLFNLSYLVLVISAT